VISLVDDFKNKLQIPVEIFEAELEKRKWSWHQLARGETPLSFDDLQLYIVCSDPVLWAGQFLREPGTGDPYTYFDYQLDSARDMGNVIHDDAAEVGKTREIGNKVLYKAYTVPGGSSLIGAPEQVHLDDIIYYIDEQINRQNPKVLASSLEKHQKHPHHVFYFTNGHRIFLSPCGFDGTGFRGKHVNCFAIMDEAAKVKNPNSWSEFFRSAMPGCVFGLYSVPDGDRGTVYFRLKELAKARAQGKKLSKEELKEAQKYELNYYKWTKPMQPPPFWTPEREKFMADMYGGKDSGGYKRNILAEDGDPENPVYSWQHLSGTFKEIPVYRKLKILSDGGEFHLEGSKVIDGEKESRSGVEELLLETTVSESGFNISDTLQTFFPRLKGLLYLGCDLGFARDPSELIVRQVYGNVWRTIARVHLKHVTYDLQADAINALDDIFNFKRIGIDFGNAGSAVVHTLQSEGRYPDKHYDERVKAYQFAEVKDDVDEHGDMILDPKTEKPRRRKVKEISTNVEYNKMQRGEIEQPFDNDIISQYSSHTYRETQNGIVYSKGNDHIIDANRACTLAMILGEGDESVMVSGVNFR